MIRKAIDNPALELHLSTLPPDGVTLFSLGPRRSEMQMRGVLIHGSRAVCQMRANHELGPLETMALGKGLLCAGLMATLLKDPGSVMVRIDGSGPAEGLSAEGMKISGKSIHARGRLFRNPFPPKALESERAMDLFGPGALTVTRIDGDSEPSVGSIPLRAGNISKDLTYYFLESEQTRTAIDSGIFFTKDGVPHGAGALLLQALPRADEAFLAAVEARLSSLPPLGFWFAGGGTRDNLVSSIFGDFGAARIAESGFGFDCPCSRGRFLGHIASLDKLLLRDILENGPWPLETTCHYCSSTYRFDKGELALFLAGRGRAAKKSTPVPGENEAEREPSP